MHEVQLVADLCAYQSECDSRCGRAGLHPNSVSILRSTPQGGPTPGKNKGNAKPYVHVDTPRPGAPNKANGFAKPKTPMMPKPAKPAAVAQQPNSGVKRAMEQPAAKGSTGKKRPKVEVEEEEEACDRSRCVQWAQRPYVHLRSQRRRRAY